MKRADVAIVGGGPAGLAAALTLTTFTAATVVVHDRERQDSARAGETLAPGAMALLRWLGVAGVLAEAARPCVARRAAWGGGPPRSHEHLFDAEGGGLFLDRGRFEAGLAARLADRETGSVSALGVSSIAGSAGDWHLRRQGLTVTRARFVIDASGRSARIARALGARRQRSDRLVGLVGRLPDRGGNGASEELLIEAVAQGWWYTGLLPGGTRVAALMTDGDIARETGLLTTAGWHAALERTNHVGGLVDGDLPQAPEVHPAETAVLDSAAGAGWAAAGDAATSVDPLSGMGLGQALATGIHAARVAAEQLEGNDSRLTAAYIDGVAGHFAECQRRREAFYGLERRWPGAPFWRRRQPPSAISGRPRQTHA